jgi:hypothetical protein
VRLMQGEIAAPHSGCTPPLPGSGSLAPSPTSLLSVEPRGAARRALALAPLVSADDDSQCRTSIGSIHFPARSLTARQPDVAPKNEGPLRCARTPRYQPIAESSRCAGILPTH